MDGESAGVGVLDDGDCGFGEVGRYPPSGVGVEIVGVGHVYAVQPLGSDYPASRKGGRIECGLLVWILAVTEVGCAIVSEGEFRPGGVAGVGGEVAGDGGVVEGDVLECLAGEFRAARPS